MTPEPDAELREEIRGLLHVDPSRRFNADAEVDRILTLVMETIPHSAIGAGESLGLRRADYTALLDMTSSELRRLLDHRCDRLPAIIVRWLCRSNQIAEMIGIRPATRTRRTGVMRARAPGVTTCDGSPQLTTVSAHVSFMASSGPFGELPVAVSPAENPHDLTSLLLDSFSAAAQARHGLSKDALQGKIMPVIASTGAPALEYRENGYATGSGVAYGDHPAVLQAAVRSGVPFVLQTFVGQDGSLVAPPHMALDLSPVTIDRYGREIRPFGTQETHRHVAQALRDRVYPELESRLETLESLDGDDRLSIYRHSLVAYTPGGRIGLTAALLFSGDDALTAAVTNLDVSNPLEAQTLAVAMHVLGSPSAFMSMSDCRSRYHRFARLFDLNILDAESLQHHLGLLAGAYATIAVRRLDLEE
jgi:hypothetical protein